MDDLVSCSSVLIPYVEGAPDYANPSARNSPVDGSTNLVSMYCWWKTMHLVMFGVATPHMLPISLRITSPYGMSSEKNLALWFNLTRTSPLGVFFKSYPSTGSIGKGTLEYPILVLNILFKLEVSEIYPWYIVRTLSFNGRT